MQLVLLNRFPALVVVSLLGPITEPGWDFLSFFIFWRDFIDVSDALERDYRSVVEQLFQVAVVYLVPAFDGGFLKFRR